MILILIVIQILSGFLLTFYYENSTNAFFMVWSIHLEVFSGRIIHYIHLNFSSFIFIFLYSHILKSFFNLSYLNIKYAWISGWVIILLTIGVAFLGYVLTWGQIRLWGATVIINILRAIPLGDFLVKWLWGGYFVSVFTMKLFFSLHFLIPIIIIVVRVIHIITLHYYGSSNVLGVSSNIIKDDFGINYLIKDLINLIIIIILLLVNLGNPYTFRDPEKFILANPILSPLHIKPEWHFLHYYAILRSIPNKLGGVFMFLLAVVILLILAFYNRKILISSKIITIYNIVFLIVNVILIYLGGCPVEYPFLDLSIIFTSLYFVWFLLYFYILKFINNIF